jgi:hypothetical protein
MGEKSGYGEMRVVHLQGADAGAPFQELPALEKAAENAVGGGAAGYRKGEEPLHDPGSVADGRCTRLLLDSSAPQRWGG